MRSMHAALMGLCEETLKTPFLDCRDPPPRDGQQPSRRTAPP
jgi:hypothetical protein